MKIHSKILLISLPVMLLAILVASGITYELSRRALTDAAERWLAVQLPDAMKIVEAEADSGDGVYASLTDTSLLPASLKSRQASAKTLLARMTVGQQGYVFVIDQLGQVIVHPNPRLASANVSQEDWYQQIRGQPSGRITYRWQGASYLAMYQQFQPWGWTLLVADPTSEVYGSIDQAGMLALLLGTACILICALILMTSTRVILRPLALLEAGAAQIGMGNLSVQIPVKTKDEVGKLGSEFNAMAGQLQKTLQALQASEQKFRSLIENSSDIVLVLDTWGTVMYTAPSVQNLGYTPEEVTGRPVYEFLHPDDTAAVTKALKSLVQDVSRTPPLEVRARKKNGGWRTLEAAGRNQLDDPSVGGIVIHGRDLEERKRAEKVQNAIYRISEAAQKAPNLEVLFSDINAIISELMPAKNFYVALYNEREDLLTFPYFVDEFDKAPQPSKPDKGLTEYVLRTNEPLLATPEKFDELVRLGEVLSVGANSIDWLGVPLRLAGKAIGVLVVQSYTEQVRFKQQDKDILTFVCEQASNSIARKQAEEAERENEQRYQEIFENSPVSLWEEDFSEVKAYLEDLKSQGIRDFNKYFELHPDEVDTCARLIKVIDVNQATLRMLDVDNKEYLLSNLDRVFGYKASEVTRNELLAIADGRLDYEGSGTSLRMTGGKFYYVLRWSISPAYQENLNRVIVSVMDVSERTRSEERVQSQIRRLNALRAIDSSITGSLDLKSTLNVLLDEVVRELKVDAAAVLLLDPQILTLDYAASVGFHTTALKHTHLRIGEGYAGRAAMERRMIFNTNLLTNPGDLDASTQLVKEGFTAYLAMPLIAKGVVKGVLEIFNRTGLDTSEEWLDFMETLSGQAAIAIDNATLFNDLQRTNLDLSLAYDATIEGWSRALDLRDRETEGHTQRVTDLTMRLALMMGVNKSALVHVRWGALLHDIGKMAIPDSILLKPGPLEQSEMEIMQKHPVYAYDMLKPIKYLRQAIEIPYYHHERWNGTGYPCKLMADEIPLAARIFMVVDVWDALCSDRPYRKAWPEIKVREYLKTQSGALFDPAVAEAFLTMIDQVE